MATSAAIYLVNVPDEENEEVDPAPFQTLQGPKGRTTRVEWVDGNRILLTVGEDGYARHWDVEVSGGAFADNYVENVQSENYTCF